MSVIVLLAAFSFPNSSSAYVKNGSKISHPQHELAEKQMNGYSSLFSFEVNIPMEDMRIWANSLKYFGMGVSWGGYHSLIKLTESHHSQKTVICRMYIGLEDTNELISDIIEAFKKIGQVCK
ncbi:PLP-dependent transferase [Priestia aryabhattai]|uniref:PLP-dependent transferase n=1 Tax=Priestia aryabhattai TaxID=412384 RepID=UPI003CC663A4